jgi:hypothetical protein
VGDVKKFIFACLLALLVLGCSSNEIQRISGSSKAMLDPKQSVYVAVPKDPSDDYQGIGQYVATTIAGKFSDNDVQVTMGNAPESMADDLSAAKKQGAGYLIVPVILSWEHNATQWSFNPSTMGIRITIINVQTGTQIRTDNLESRSSHISFFGTDPKDLLDDELDDYMDDLYKK